MALSFSCSNKSVKRDWPTAGFAYCWRPLIQTLGFIMLPTSKYFHIALLLLLSASASADWFTSSEVREQIKKADSGDMSAQFDVGVAYDLGKGAPKDIDKAKKYYLLAAEQEHAEAQNSLGSLYEAEGNNIEAASWYYKAAQHNHPLAMNSLAIYYIKGVGMPEDKKKGLELYTKSAELGWCGAMYNLGIEYISGNIVDKDANIACSWIFRSHKYAIKSGYKTIFDASTKAMLTLKDKYLSKEEFEKCLAQEKEWVPPFQSNLTSPSSGTR